MKMRTYLTLSYLAIVVMVTLGVLVLAESVFRALAEQHVRLAEEAVRSVTETNLKLSEELLAMYGKKIVEMKADEVADRLHHRLGGLPGYDYEQLRSDESLRRLATQDIPAYKRRRAGYTDVYDRTGVSVWHPNRSLEGRNFAEWRSQFPDMWQLVERSFTEERVSGYYDFWDENTTPKRKYMVLVRAPETPFIVAATVVMDEFFKPVHDEITNQSEQAIVRARKSIEDSSNCTLTTLRIVSLIGSMFLLGIGALFALWFGTAVSRPIMRLREAVAKMGEGNWTVDVPEQGALEVRDLGTSFNVLGKHLTDYIEKRDFIRDTFGRYLTQEVVAQVLESEKGLELGGEAREITMIMSDIRGFTALIAGMQPQRIVFFLNRYLGKMVEIIQSHKGIVDEIMGDGIFAFFGAPQSLPDHPAQAVACALRMQAAMEEVNALNAADGFAPIEMGIAVHTGIVVVANIGSEKRTKYGAVGADVNVTGRMEAYAVGGQVLVSQATYDKIPQLLEVADVLTIQMKGVAQTSVLYDVVGIAKPYGIRLRENSDELVPLRDHVQVCLYTLDRKTVSGPALRATITHFSPKRVKISSAYPLDNLQEMKVQILDHDLNPVPGESYAKVVSTLQVESHYECVMRFTFAHGDVIEALKHAATV